MEDTLLVINNISFHDLHLKGCNIYWGKVDAFGCTAFQGIEQASESAICSGLLNGHGIVANVNGGMK